MALISFHNADRTLKLRSKRLLKQFIQQLFHEEHKELKHLSYIFCSNEYLLKINQQFLKHDYYTDIITFDLSDNEKTSGEVYISLDQVGINCVDFEVCLESEILRVIFHGALHLCGYKDKKKDDKVLMRAKEDYYLVAYHEFLNNVSRETKIKNKDVPGI